MDSVWRGPAEFCWLMECTLGFVEAGSSPRSSQQPNSGWLADRIPWNLNAGLVGCEFSASLRNGGAIVSLVSRAICLQSDFHFSMFSGGNYP
jgi:hypothetical protein